jgi:hypothetical protein
MKKFAAALTAGLLIGGIGLAGAANAAGATQVSGTIDGGPCNAPPSGFNPPSYAFPVAGDLEGCVYGVITSSRYHEGSGTYQEVADEIFVGTYGSLEGSFEMTENYTAKDGADNVTGLYFARCKHPIKTGTGTGDFDGVTGRLDFKDDTDAGTSTYTGHLRFG